MLDKLETMRHDTSHHRACPPEWRRGYWIWLVAFICAILVPLSRANEIQKKAIAQDNACANGLNTITVTLQVANKLYRSDDAFQEANPSASRLQVSKLVATGQEDTSELPVVDRQRAFSKSAVAAEDIANIDTKLKVDNAFRAGLAVNMTVQLDQEVVKIMRIEGGGCNKSHVVHVGCWNVLTVQRAQHGSKAAFHGKGTLVYKVIVAALMDHVKLDDGSFGIGNANPWFNVDHLDGFEASVDGDNGRYVQINREIARVDQILDMNGTVGVGDEYSFLLPKYFSDVDDYYQNVDIVFLSRPATGEGGQDVVLQRRKIVKYRGFMRYAEFTEKMDPLPVPGVTRFHMKAFKVRRGEQDTGNRETVGVPPNILVTYLGQIHLQLSPIFYLGNSWSTLLEKAQWTKTTGVIDGGFFADTIPGQTMIFSVPLINPPSPQIPQNVTISVNGPAGVQTATEVLLWDLLAGAERPIVFPLLICHAGTWMKSGDVTCTDCVIGKYSESCGGLGCYACPPATYTSVARQTACTDCEVGYYCVGNSDRSPCPPGQFSEAKSSTCQSCTRGHFCPGARYQIACSEGQFMNETGSTACLSCTAGKYAGVEGAWNCTFCREGTMSVVQSAACSECQAGTYAVGIGNTQCLNCGENTYQPLTGTSTCTLCPKNTGARKVMGVCTGACEGSKSKADCLCFAGFTRFGQTSDECVAFNFKVTKMGQSTACAAKQNIIGVTLQTNAQLTTAVQSIAIVNGGQGYAPASLQVVEPGGKGFVGQAFTSPIDGMITGIEIAEGGAQYTGNPEAVNIFFSPNCADVDAGCISTLQEGKITFVRIVNAGKGYVAGTVRISGGGSGSGAEAYFVSDIDGAIKEVRFEDISKHGKGYTSPVTLNLIFPSPRRCDKDGSNGIENAACDQHHTITLLTPGQGQTATCDTFVRLIAVGGGGQGFYAAVKEITPFGSIQRWEIVNHGAGYTSDPDFQIEAHASCTCQGKTGNSLGAFNPCVSFFRARDAVLTAQPALKANLRATTGSRVVLRGLESGSMLHPRNAVPIYAIGSASITSGETQSCGILPSGNAVCFGKSEQYFTKEDVQTWTCGYRAQYYRFTPIFTRNGGRTVQLAEIEFYTKDSTVKLPVVAASNPGGVNPSGFDEKGATSAASDGDSETRWAVLNLAPLQLDFGSAVVIDRYRWMTTSANSEADPVAWRIEAANDPTDGDHWVKIHEVSPTWHGTYTVGKGQTSSGIEYFLRNEWTRFWTGGCSIPESQKWRSVSVQAFHGCGINNAGIGQCWGHNSMRQLVFPDAPCTCAQKYDTYCSCSSANYVSTVYRKMEFDAAPGQCDANGRCFNTYSTGTCTSKECRYIYTAAECSQAGKMLGYIASDSMVMNPGNSPYSPKGCYLISDTQVSNRVRFNMNNESDSCTERLNCVCKDCPSFWFILYGENSYCGGTFDTEEKTKANELVGARTIDECKAACGNRTDCDFFTFYPEKASVGCAPCCFKKDTQCDLIDPSSVVPKVGTVKETSTWSYLSAGYLHTCGITMAGTLTCWGFNRDQQASPPKALASRKWRLVSAGKFHSCGILDDLTAHCWGANDQKLNTGQVLPIPGLGAYKWRSLTCGVWHTCGITQEGIPYCWGCGGKDRLGRTIGSSATGEDANKGQCDIPKKDGQIWDMVSASEFHTCGVTSTGEAHCWGCKCNPTLCPSWNSSNVDLGQCNVPPGYRWSQIAVGRRHTCGLTIDGDLLCWGCILDVRKPYHTKSGKIEYQQASQARTFDLGQCHKPEGFKLWMNSAAFSALGKWDEGVNGTKGSLTVQVRSSTIVGADYFFGFPIVNPQQVQSHAPTSVLSEGLELPERDFNHATPPAYGGLAVLSCKEGTYQGPDGKCLPCGPGTYALDCGVEACTACMPGQYAHIGSTSCKLCGVGRFSHSYGSTSCFACPSGTYGPVAGAVSAHDGCLNCEPGKYTEAYNTFDEFIGAWQDTGATTCATCPRGHYCVGGADKVQCPPRTYNGLLSSNSSRACMICPHGLRCNGLWPRYTCIAGSGFDNGTVFTEKVSCERACFSMDRVQGECISSQGQDNGCIDGYDGVLCSKCIEGYYPEFLGFECKECPSVWYQAMLLCAYSGLVLGIPFICDLTGVDPRISVYLRIAIFFFQNQDLALSVNVRWPTMMVTFVRALRIMNWDLMYTNPQCWFGNNDEMWQLLFLVEICLPLCVVGLIILLASMTTLIGLRRVSQAFWRLLGFYILWYFVPFVGSCLRTVECSCVPRGYELHRPSWDNCSFAGVLGGEAGRTVLTSNPYVTCHGAAHWKYNMGASGALLWIFIGIPFTLLFLPDLEPSFRNPLPVQKMTVRGKGLAKVINIGIAEDVSSGIAKSPGTGVIQFLEEKRREMQELYDMGRDEITRLEELKDEATKAGKSKEKRKIEEQMDEMDDHCIVCEERVTLISRTMEMLLDSLKHNPNVQLGKQEQLSAISRAAISYKGGLLNFVEPVHVQKRRWKDTRWKMNRVKHSRGESVLFTSPVPILWNDLRQRVQKWCKSLDIFRIRALKTAFVLGTILTIPPAILFTCFYLLWKVALWIKPVTFHQYKNIYFMWADYGPRVEFTGEIRRVEPHFAQGDVHNAEDLCGCIAVIWRGHGEQHESTMYKARRVQAAGAIAALFVNEDNYHFSPKVRAENYATFQAIDIPVMGIRASDVHYIADGSIATFSFLRNPPRPFGLRRLQFLMNLICMRPLVENYWPDKEWFETIVWARRSFLVLIKYLMTRTPQMQSCFILAVNFFYCCYTLFRPYKLSEFNRMEGISAFSCFLSSVFVASAAVLYGQVTEGVPGLEMNGSAGEFEDKAREVVFYSLSMSCLVLLILVGVCLAQPVISLCTKYIVLWITNWLRPPLPPKPKPPPEDNSLPPDIDRVCLNMLHAINEHFRVLPHHSHCRSAIDVAYGVLKEQENVIHRREHNKTQELRKKPWTVVVGRGSAGRYSGKEVLTFRHHFGGMVVEIPSHSTGDIRIQCGSDGQILTCAGDGILWKRESFFAPALVRDLETHSQKNSKKERPLLISEIDLEGDTSAIRKSSAERLVHGAKNATKAGSGDVDDDEVLEQCDIGATQALETSDSGTKELLFCPSHFGQWRASCFNPDLVVSHRVKGLEIWFTRTSAIILCPQGSAVVLREGSAEPIKTTSQIAKELLFISSVSIPGASAIRAVETSFRITAKRGKLPQWQEVDVTQPISALAAIHQTLDALPDEVFSMTRDPRMIDITDLAASVSSGSDDTVVSPEKVEIDLVTRRNSAYIHWKRPGMKSLRKEASLEPDVGQHTAQSDITRPPIPQEELKRFMTMIEHAGQALDQVAKDHGGHRAPPEDPFSKHPAVQALITRANRGDVAVLDQLLLLMESHTSPGVRALAVRAVESIADSGASDRHAMIVGTLELLMLDEDESVKAAATAALQVVDPS